MTDTKISKHWINITLYRVRIFSFWTRSLPELPTNSKHVGGWLAQNKILSKWEYPIYTTVLRINPLYRQHISSSPIKTEQDLLTYLQQIKLLKRLFWIQTFKQLIVIMTLCLFITTLFNQYTAWNVSNVYRKQLNRIGIDTPELQYPFVEVDEEQWQQKVDILSTQKDLHAYLATEHPLKEVLPHGPIESLNHLSSWKPSVDHLYSIDHINIFGPVPWAIYTEVLLQKNTGDFSESVHSISFNDATHFIQILNEKSSNEIERWRLPTSDEWKTVQNTLQTPKDLWVWTTSNTSPQLCGQPRGLVECHEVAPDTRSTFQRIYLVKSGDK